ncbi:MAG: hypothetical protein ACLR4W_10510 [Oscillospiraceae bacterium]
MKPKKKSVRLWAVVFWLLVWQGASMALAVLYPHGALLLASPFRRSRGSGAGSHRRVLADGAHLGRAHPRRLSARLRAGGRACRACRAVPPCRGAARTACVRCQGRAGRVVHHPRARVAR